MEGTTDMTIPPLFRCPISLDLFKDPVTLSTGQTYDRSCIEKWLSQGNLTCPVTMQRLDDFSMVPNHTLRHLIDNWLGIGGHSGPDCFGSSDSACSVAAARQILESELETMSSALETKLQVLDMVHSLSLELPAKNYCLIRMDFFGAVLKMALRLHSEPGFQVAERAVVCALNLMPFSDLRAFNMLQEKAEYEGFVCLFEQGSVLIKKGICLMVEAIASNLETQNVCRNLGNSPKLVQGIVHLVRDTSEASEAGIRAAFALSTLNCESLVRQGAVEGLLDYLSQRQGGKGRLAPAAMSTIENLLAVESAKVAVTSHQNGVKTVVKMVFTVSDHSGSESAVNALTILCSDSRAARETAVLEGVLIQLLLLLQSQCSGRTKGKARMLLKLIRAKWNEDMNHGL